MRKKILKIKDRLIFKLKFFIKHNKSVVAMWILFLSFLWYYRNNDQIQIIHAIVYVFPSLIALTGLLYVSFHHTLRNGMYDEEIKVLFELMDKILEIIQGIQDERQPDLLTHHLLIEIYQEKFQNRNYFILGAVEQHNLISYLTDLFNSPKCIYLPPKCIYLPPKINKEIQKLNTKNFNIITSQINHLKNLSINNKKIGSDCNLIKNNNLWNQKYKGYLVPIVTFKQFFNEEEIKKLKLVGLDISKCDEKDVIVFNIDEKSFKEINTLIYKIYSLAYEKIEKIVDESVF